MLVDFYHLNASPLERVLASVCEKLLPGGGRLLIVADAGLIARLDDQLWSYGREAFLPHGTSDQPGAAEQPILLSTESEPTNGATNIALADGLWRDEALRFERAFYFFDETTLGGARESWKALKDRGVERRYWKQDDRGKWVQGP